MSAYRFLPRLLSFAAPLLVSSLVTSSLFAQDVAITNARIIVGTGPVIEKGVIVVKGGKIASVGATGDTKGLKIIDAKGMTALPGFIDGHKHVGAGPMEKEQMQSLLEAGYTTILSGGGQPGSDVTLRDHIESGMINGPRILPSVRINLRGTPDEARAAIREAAAKGIKYTSEIVLTPVPAPPQSEIDVLKATVEEGAKAGVQVDVHSVSSTATMAALNVGVRRFVHLVNKDWVSRDDAAKVAAAGAIIDGLNAFGAPIVDRESPAPAPVVFPKDDKPRFRDGKDWPEAIAGANRDANGKAMGTEAGYTIVNARTHWDASNDSVAYSTDQNYADKVVLEHELKSFSIMFSMADIFKIMGPNTAKFVGMADQIGTLETGKLADIVLLDGDPRENIYPMLNTKIVLKGGKVVVDKTAPAKKAKK
jgi:imidazolonepropionase-like amidohydrolase